MFKTYFRHLIPRKLYLEVALCLLVIILGTFSEALGLGLIMPFLSTVLGESSNVGVAVYLDSMFGELSLIDIAIVILCLFLVKFLLSVYKNYLMYGFEWKIRGFWMSSIYKLTMLQDYAHFEHDKPGFIVNSITNETLKAASAFRQLLEYVAQILQLLALSTILLISNFAFSAFALCIVAVTLLFIKYFIVSKTRGHSRWRQEYEEDVAHEVNEMIQGMLTIRAFVLEEHFLKKFRNAVNKLVLLVRRTEVIRRLPMQILEVLVVILVVMYVIVGQMMKIDMSSQLPFLGVMFVVSLRLFSNAGSLATNYMSIYVLWASVIKVTEYLSHSLLSENTVGVKKVNTNKILDVDEVRFNDVTFGYSASSPVIQHANLTFKKASIISITGESGSGKSTIGKLLMLFYRPMLGDITVNGYSLADVGDREWRKLVGYVDQNYFFFYGSILENLVLGLDEYTLEEVDSVLEITHSRSFVREFSEGLDTCVGDKGNLLSGGQKARLALARVLLRKPKILVLDEVTSALDSATKEKIAESIEKLGKKMMVVVISHDAVMTGKAKLIYRVQNSQVSTID